MTASLQIPGTQIPTGVTKFKLNQKLNSIFERLLVCVYVHVYAVHSSPCTVYDRCF